MRLLFGILPELLLPCHLLNSIDWQVFFHLICTPQLITTLQWIHTSQHDLCLVFLMIHTAPLQIGHIQSKLLSWLWYGELKSWLYVKDSSNSVGTGTILISLEAPLTLGQWRWPLYIRTSKFAWPPLDDGVVPLSLLNGDYSSSEYCSIEENSTSGSLIMLSCGSKASSVSETSSLYQYWGFKSSGHELGFQRQNWETAVKR